MRHNRIIAAAGAVLLFISCAGIPDGPDWMYSYPANPAFYVGIGSSNSGNEAEDSEIARKRALANLASEISAVIKSDVSYRMSDYGGGNVETEAVEEISQLVEQNLKAVETVDSWYRPGSGYWYYLRLNKALWMQIQQREMAEIEKRVGGIVEPVLADPASTDADVLKAMASGWKIVADSPYTGMIRTTLGGREGVLIDLLETGMDGIVSGLSIRTTGAVKAELNRPVGFELSVVSKSGRAAGVFPVRIISRSTGGVISAFSTDRDGSYAGKMDVSGFDPGTNYAYAAVDTEALGLGAGSYKVNLPGADFTVDVAKIRTSLEVGFSGDTAELPNPEGLRGSVQALLSDILPVEIAASGAADYSVRFTLDYRDAPPNGYGFIIIYCKANIGIYRNGSSIYGFESEEAKGAGLDRRQAADKAVTSLFEKLVLDPDLAAEAVQAFTIE